MFTPFVVNRLDLARLFDCVRRVGAASTTVLEENFRQSLLREAERYRYKPEQEIIGSGDRVVRQQLSSVEGFADASEYILLKDAFQTLVDRSLAISRLQPFKISLRFNSMALQKYEDGSLGITPHRDNIEYVNLICIFLIGGGGRFYVCKNRSGAAPIQIPAQPGDVILMRGPGFSGMSDRPFHYINDIQRTRYSFGLRQRRCLG